MASQLATNGVCAICVAERPQCSSCGEPVLNGQRLRDGSERVFCQNCIDTRPTCWTCGAPVGGQSQTPREGRPRCATCDETAVDDPAEAQALYRDIQRLLAQRFGLSLAVPTPLIPVDRDQFKAVLAELGNYAEQHHTLPRGVYARIGMRRGIYVELGLPRAQLVQIIAHEIGHAWQMENNPVLEDPVAVEGFAEWIAYQALLACGETSLAQNMLVREDLYGEGLRHMAVLAGTGQNWDRIRRLR